jgi:hypothetical protein
MLLTILLTFGELPAAGTGTVKFYYAFALDCWRKPRTAVAASEVRVLLNCSSVCTSDSLIQK